MGKQRQQIIAPNPAKHAVNRLVVRLVIRVCHPDISGYPPVFSTGGPAAPFCAFQDRLPMADHVILVEGQAHGNEAAFAGNFERLGCKTDRGHTDGWMGLLEGFYVVLQRAVLGLRQVDVPELPLVFKGLVFRPKLEDYVNRLAGHLSVLAVQTVNVEHCVVGGQATSPNAKHEPTLSHVVQVGDAAGQLCGMVVRQQVNACPQTDILGQHQSLGDHQVWRRYWLPRGGIVFSDPSL